MEDRCERRLEALPLEWPHDVEAHSGSDRAAERGEEEETCGVFFGCVQPGEAGTEQRSEVQGNVLAPGGFLKRHRVRLGEGADERLEQRSALGPAGAIAAGNGQVRFTSVGQGDRLGRRPMAGAHEGERERPGGPERGLERLPELVGGAKKPVPERRLQPRRVGEAAGGKRRVGELKKQDGIHELVAGSSDAGVAQNSV